MMELKITLELCAEDRARLDQILDTLAAGRPNCERCVQCFMDMAASILRPGDKLPAPQAETEPPAPDVTLDQVRRLALELSVIDDGKKKAQVKAVVNDYADKISALPQDKLPEVMARLEALAQDEAA